jgi:hypothetical protein
MLILFREKPVDVQSIFLETSVLREVVPLEGTNFETMQTAG